MTKRRSSDDMAKDRARKLVASYESRLRPRDPSHPASAGVFDELVDDVAKALMSHAKAEVLRVTGDWDHGF